MWDERYQWWIEQREKTGKYPDSFKGFYEELAEKNMPPEERARREEEKKAAAAAKAEKGKKKKPDKKAEKKDKKGKKGKKGKKAAADPVVDEKLTHATLLGPSPLVNHMLECVGKYKGVWSVIDEHENANQTHDQVCHF